MCDETLTGGGLTLGGLDTRRLFQRCQGRAFFCAGTTAEPQVCQILIENW
jgi:hypothetical protein